MNTHQTETKQNAKLITGIIIGVAIAVIFGTVFYFGWSMGSDSKNMMGQNETPDKKTQIGQDDNTIENNSVIDPQQNIVYTKNGSIWKANVVTNQTELIIEDTYARNPLFSPDGTKILYFSINETYKQTIEQSNEQQLPFPINYDLWLADADGSNKIKVFQSNENQEIVSYNTKWSPDSRYFVTSTDTDKSDSDIFIYDSEGKQKAIIPMSIVTNMTVNRILWAPNSRRIAIFGIPVDQYIPGKINPTWNTTVIYDIDGTLVDKYERDGVYFLPSLWSAYDENIYVVYVGNGIGSYALYKDVISGSELVFVSGVEDTADISKRAAQENPDQVDTIFEESALMGGDTIFSPDGSMLVSIRQDTYVDEGESRIWMMDVDGTNVRQVISDNQELNENRDINIIPIIVTRDNKHLIIQAKDTSIQQTALYAISLPDGETTQIDSWTE
jgi:hypothetical protein